MFAACIESVDVPRCAHPVVLCASLAQSLVGANGTLISCVQGGTQASNSLRSSLSCLLSPAAAR